MAAKLKPIGPESIAEAARIVKQGGLVVYPTDTVYGLGCDPFDATAVGRLFRVKGRGPKPVPVLCDSIGSASDLVLLNSKAMELARLHWPGALTIVAPLRRKVPPLLSQERDNLGVRVPGHSGCLKLIASCGGWLTGTSANVSGRPSSKAAGEAMEQLGGAVDIILDGGVVPGMESTVVQVVGENVAILRTGPIGVESRVKTDEPHRNLL